MHELTNDAPTVPYEESRRLTGPNLYFSATGAALESAAGVAFDAATVRRWRENIEAARGTLQWPRGETTTRVHAKGVSLAFAAPFDQLYAATAVNEWAWCDALGTNIISDLEELAEATSREHALQLLRDAAQAEASPSLVALHDAAHRHGVPILIDDDAVSIGMGHASQTWPRDALPSPEAVPWTTLHAIPCAMVTGSNGKTTTVRLLAAMLRAQGGSCAWSSTEGVHVDGVLLDGGDYSGPGGARAALRHPAAHAAVLETARGGLLRRGVAIERADVAIVTNVSTDHFGEYGIHDLAALAQVKASVARVIDQTGLLVLNADDALLRDASTELSCPLGWFGLDADASWLQARHAAGEPICALRNGHAWLHDGECRHDLGNVTQMPLTWGGRARHNIANLCAAALAAHAMGVSAHAIADTLMRFGSAPTDNPGRLQRWQFGDMQVIVDYAHNIDGWRELLHAVDARSRTGRLGVLLGHAGNREDEDLRNVAAAVAAALPDRILLKEIAGYERGRAPGEIAGIMRDALLERGMPAPSLVIELDEAQAARVLLEWASDGDLILLPIHQTAARARAESMLHAMHDAGWRAGDPVPALPIADAAS